MTSTSQTPLLSMRSIRCFLVIMGFGLGAIGFSGPSIQVEAPHFDFGERRTGDEVRHAFVIRNAGNDLLKISNVRASCGCTVPQNTSLEIPPGNTEDLPVRISLAGRKGPQRQTVTFTTNDPENPLVSLRLSGKATPVISVEPGTLNLGHLAKDDPATGSFLVASTDGETFRITKAQAKKNLVDITVLPLSDGTSYEIRVQPKDVIGDGVFTDVVEISTDHPEAKRERVLVLWQVQSGVTVSPSAVNLVLADRPQRLNRYLMVKGTPGLEPPLEVLKVTWPGQEQVDIAIMDTQRFGWRIHLRSFEPLPSMNDSVIEIKTNAEGFKTLQVPVNIVN